MGILLQTPLFRGLSLIIALSTFVSSGLMSYRTFYFNVHLSMPQILIFHFIAR